MGDPAGISAEITIKSWLTRANDSVPPFVFFGSDELLHERAKLMKCNIKTKKIKHLEGAPVDEIFKEFLPVFDIPIIYESPGKYTGQNNRQILESILIAHESISKGITAALVTNPVNKNSLAYEGLNFSGQTELCAYLCKASSPVMLMMNDTIKVVPLTRHIPLSKVAQTIDPPLIEHAVSIINKDLKKYFDISKPKIVLTGLNPHAGDSGLLGDEEINIISPTITKLQKKGIDIHGPASADSLFYSKNLEKYDLVICMYHDQALIPIKTIAGYSAINVTLGINIVRTSPDHGTAYEIAEKNIANPSSLIRSLIAADHIAQRDVPN